MRRIFYAVLVLIVAVLVAQRQERPRTTERPGLPSAPASTASATWGQPRTLLDHYERHGADFRASSAEDYATQAAAFRERALRGGVSMKLDETGVLRVFDPATGAFGAYNRDGTTRTYFKPGSRDYFTRQPGRPVQPADLR